MIRFVEDQNGLYDVFVFLRLLFKKDGVFVTAKKNKKQVLQRVGKDTRSVVVIDNDGEKNKQLAGLKNEPIEFIVFDANLDLSKQDIQWLQRIKDIYIIKGEVV